MQSGMLNTDTRWAGNQSDDRDVLMNITLLYIWRVASTRSGCKSTIYHYSSLTIDPNLQQDILVGYHLGVVPSDIELQVCFRVLIFLEIRPPTIQICFLLFFFGIFLCIEIVVSRTTSHNYTTPIFVCVYPPQTYIQYIYMYMAQIISIHTISGHLDVQHIRSNGWRWDVSHFHCGSGWLRRSGSGESPTWWFRNPAFTTWGWYFIPLMYRVLAPSQVVVWDFSHQP